MAPSVFAAAPSPVTVTSTNGNGPSGASSAQFLTWKNDFQVVSGVKRNQAKGTVATMSITSTPMKVLSLPKGSKGSAIPNVISCPPGSTPPCSDELTTTLEANIMEPSDGTHPNFGSGTAETDDANKAYGSAGDENFFGLCGPGAADVAMFYWPTPNNNLDVANVADPLTGLTTTWNDHDIDGGVYRYRGYMVYLAWQMYVSGWTSKYKGLMDQYNANPPHTGGVRLQELSGSNGLGGGRAHLSVWFLRGGMALRCE